MIIMRNTDTPTTANIDTTDIDNLNMELQALNTHKTPALGDSRGCDPLVHADGWVAE